jgi:hypothetical protein
LLGFQKIIEFSFFLELNDMIHPPPESATSPISSNKRKSPKSPPMKQRSSSRIPLKSRLEAANKLLEKVVKYEVYRVNEDTPTRAHSRFLSEYARVAMRLLEAHDDPGALFEISPGLCALFFPS